MSQFRADDGSFAPFAGVLITASRMFRDADGNVFSQLVWVDRPLRYNEEGFTDAPH